MIEKFLRTVFGVWALLVFSLSLLIAGILYFFIFSFLPAAKAPHIAHRKVSRNWAGILFILFGVRVVIKNKSVLKANQVYVFAANHRSMLDIPAYALSCSHTFRFLAKAELTKIPVLGYIIRHLYISVDRKNKAARAKSMENMQGSLEEGISVFICPEGTRNKSDAPLLPFHDGAFRLAIAAQVPLAVLTILNSGELLSPKHPLMLKPGRIYCVWAEPVDTKGMTEADIPMLRERVRAIMETELKKA
jgi:1-acyl-sn-glycerol-3-phosphate acyltransferase